MKCVVTGKETNNKWRGYPLCREVIQMAKETEGKNGFQGCTIRERIIIIQRRWKERVEEEAGLK